MALALAAYSSYLLNIQLLSWIKKTKTKQNKKSLNFG